MSSKLTRRVTLPPSRMKSSRERINLLTYRMALAQPTATVPLLQPTSHHTDSVSNAADALSNFRSMSRSITSADGAGGGGGAGCSPATHQSSADEGSHPPDFSRRWVRDADELCVASISRSQSINRINCYVASYKFDDPLWRPFLLPEVHVIPRSTADTGLESGDTPEPASPTMKNGYDVHIDYSKLVNLELISRHANYALRHLVQKGHAMYFVNYAQHSILQMRGLVECTYITCSYGIKGERLRTYLTHVGPLDVRDVMEVDPKTGQVHFHVNKPGVARGVVAVSQVEGYGTWFQRKPMLWQRTRRIGALQSQIGAFEYQLCSPESVGRLREYEISLLQPHLRFHGSGGAEAVGMIASSQVAQNNKLYLGEFEAPAIAALDAVHQLAHQVAVHEKLLKPSASVAGASSTSTPADGVEELRQMAAMDRLLPVSWITRTPPPYVPLEADLPFKLQLSKPAVFTPVSSSKKDSPVTHEPHFPTGGTVGTPFIKGVPLSLMEYIMHQGVDHYVFDDAPSARPMKWWNQVSNMPYNGYLYFMRSSLLDSAEAAEAMENPLAPPQQSSRRSGGAARRLKRKKLRRASEPSAGVVPTEAYAETQEVDEHPAADKKAASLSASDAVGRDPLHLLVPPGPRAMRRMAKLNARAATSPVNAVAVMARRRLRRKKQRDSSRQPTSP